MSPAMGEYWGGRSGFAGARRLARVPELPACACLRLMRSKLTSLLDIVLHEERLMPHLHLSRNR